MRWEEIDTQVCSIARSLAIFGDRWTLLIVRDAFRKIRRFSEFQASLGITKHRLSDRLTRLVDEGVFDKVLYDEKRFRYEYRLTQKGLDIYPLLMALVQWGDKWATDQDGVPIAFVHKSCGHKTHPKYICDVCDEEIHAKSLVPEIGPGIEKKLQRGELKADKGKHQNIKGGPFN